MKRSLFLLAILSILFLSGCAVFEKHFAQARSLDISGTAVMQVPVVADLDVSNTKVTEEYTITTSVNLKNMNYFIDQAKSNAIVAAVQKHSADVLVEPIYEVHITKAGYGKSDVRVVVTGFPATYKNFRSATKSDMEIIDGTRKSCDVKH